MRPKEQCSICGKSVKEFDSNMVEYLCGTKIALKGPYEGEVIVKGWGCKPEKATVAV